MTSLKDIFKLPKIQHDLCTPCGIIVDGEIEGFEINAQQRFQFFSCLSTSKNLLVWLPPQFTHSLHSLEQWES